MYLFKSSNFFKQALFLLLYFGFSMNSNGQENVTGNFFDGANPYYTNFNVNLPLDAPQNTHVYDNSPCGTTMTLSLNSVAHAGAHIASTIPNQQDISGFSECLLLRIINSPSSNSIIHTITFSQPVDNFKFSIHGINGDVSNNQSNKESIGDFNIDGQSITNLNNTTIVTHNSPGPANRLITNDNGTRIKGFNEWTINPWTEISINKQAISQITFTVFRNHDAGHMLSNYSFTDNNCCATTPTLCCATPFSVPVMDATGSNNLGCSQIFDNGLTVNIGTYRRATWDFTSTSSNGWLGGVGSVLPVNGSLTGAFALDVDGYTRSTGYYSLSDARLKKDIQPIENALSLIRELNGVTYNWKKNDALELGNMPQVGFLAQELKEVIPEAVIEDEGGYYTVNYNTIIPVLTEALKEQDAKILEMEEKLSQLEKMIVQNNEASMKEKGEFKLFQNAPNPSTTFTKFEYFLGVETNNAYLKIYDMEGREIRATRLNNQKGFGSFDYDTSQLAKGTYIYTLIIDGEIISTKQMVIVNNTSN